MKALNPTLLQINNLSEVLVKRTLTLEYRSALELINAAWLPDLYTGCTFPFPDGLVVLWFGVSTTLNLAMA